MCLQEVLPQKQNLCDSITPSGASASLAKFYANTYIYYITFELFWKHVLHSVITWKVKKSIKLELEFNAVCLLQVSGAQTLRRASPAGNEGTLQASAANCALLCN